MRTRSRARHSSNVALLWAGRSGRRGTSDHARQRHGYRRAPITENHSASVHSASGEERIHDNGRIDFVRQHLRQVARAP